MYVTDDECVLNRFMIFTNSCGYPFASKPTPLERRIIHPTPMHMNLPHRDYAAMMVYTQQLSHNEGG